MCLHFTARAYSRERKLEARTVVSHREPLRFRDVGDGRPQEVAVECLGSLKHGRGAVGFRIKLNELSNHVGGLLWSSGKINPLLFSDSANFRSLLSEH